MLLVFALLVVVYLLSVRPLPFSAIEDYAAGLGKDVAQNDLGIAVKIAVSHLQLLGLVPYEQVELPQWLTSLWQGSGRSSISPNLSFVACAVGSSPVAQLKAVLGLLGVLASAFAVVAVGMSLLDHNRFLRKSRRSFEQERAKLYQQQHQSPFVSRVVDHAAIDSRTKRRYRAIIKRTHAEFLERYHEECFDESKLRERPPSSPPLWRRVVTITLLTTVVSMFFVYPTIVSACVAVMNACQSR